MKENVMHYCMIACWICCKVNKYISNSGLIIIIIIIIIINQGTNVRRCPMPLSLFDAIFVSPKQRGIILVLMPHTILL